MRNFLLVLILIFSFQSLTKADDVRDFQIGEMSVGDSLLNFITKKSIITEIENKGTSVYYDNDYVSILLSEMKNKLLIYNDVKAVIKQNDQSYKPGHFCTHK